MVGGVVSLASLVLAPELSVRAQRRDRQHLARGETYLDALKVAHVYVANCERWVLAPDAEEYETADRPDDLARMDAMLAVYGSDSAKVAYSDILTSCGQFVGRLGPALVMARRVQSHYDGTAPKHESEIADLEMRAIHYRAGLTDPLRQLQTAAARFELVVRSELGGLN